MLPLAHFNISDVGVYPFNVLHFLSFEFLIIHKSYSYYDIVNHPNTFMTLINNWREGETGVFIS